MKYLYPEVRFPPLYVVVGRFNSGGTAKPAGLILGAEMLPEPERIPHLVLHELVHYQQSTAPENVSLLGKALREGGADFVAELATGRPPEAEYMPYGLAHEAELWAEFRERMLDPNHYGWLYGSPPPGRPSDLGYFVGYRIAQAYYRAASDKLRAVHDIINVTDYEAFLAASGYGALANR